jgi:amidase
MVHRFNPKYYYNTLGGHRPALRIASGDTVLVPTLDAHGYNQKNEQKASGPNPVAGPVYIEGAVPGDALVVEIYGISLTRNTGWSSTVLADTTIETSYARSLPEKEYAQWGIDTKKRTATIIEPENYRGRITLPLSPLIGCLGVSPSDGQVLTTRTAGSHGGNMDYREVRQGSILCFPVFENGALFYVGDVHAAQGEAESAGTGIETSAEVELRFSVRKKISLHRPRGENDTYIFTIGNARPLEIALQHATTEMHRWLCGEYGYDVVSASLLIGQAARYDIANAFNPAYTISCRIPKKYLRRK